MPLDVSSRVEIFAPAEIVFDFAANPENAPKWYDKIGSASWIGESGLRVGAQIAFEARFMGRQLNYIYEIVEYSAPHRLTMQTASGPFEMHTTYEVDELGNDKCAMKLRNWGEPKGFSKLLSPLMGLAVRRANNKDLRKLKSITEEMVS